MHSYQARVTCLQTITVRFVEEKGLQTMIEPLANESINVGRLLLQSTVCGQKSTYSIEVKATTLINKQC